MRKARRWDRTPAKRSILDTVLDKVLREMFPRHERPLGRRHGATRAPAQPRRQSFALEPLEPRLLMSADISYLSATPFAQNNITVSASQASGTYFVDISGDLVGGPVHQSLAGGETVINIEETGGDIAAALVADSVHFDLAGLANLTGYAASDPRDRWALGLALSLGRLDGMAPPPRSL